MKDKSYAVMELCKDLSGEELIMFISGYAIETNQIDNIRSSLEKFIDRMPIAQGTLKESWFRVFGDYGFQDVIPFSQFEPDGLNSCHIVLPKGTLFKKYKNDDGSFYWEDKDAFMRNNPDSWGPEYLENIRKL